MKHLGANAWLLGTLLTVVATATPAAAAPVAPADEKPAAKTAEPVAWPVMVGGFVVVIGALRRRGKRSLYSQAA